MPVQITTTIKNDTLYQSGLKRVAAATDYVTAELARTELETARDEARAHPPELAGQRYVRTGKRYAATRVEAYQGNNQHSKSYTVVSDPSYGGRSADPYVLGDAQGRGQAGIHAGRWAILFERVQAALERIADASIRALLDAWGLE